MLLVHLFRNVKLLAGECYRRFVLEKICRINFTVVGTGLVTHG